MATASLSYDSGFKPAIPFYSGSAFSSQVPWPYPVSLDGHNYQIQWDKDSIGVWGAKFKRETVPLVRNQADNSNTPGEQSISPEQLWRRSQDTWLGGEGQTYLDRATSIPNRYHDSIGINPWNPWQLSLLNDTSRAYTSTNTGLACLNTGTNIYLIDGSTLKFTPDLSAYTSVTGMTGSPLSMDTDGGNIYTANNTNGIYSGTLGGASVSSYATGTVTLVRYTKSRLMAAGDGKLYNVIASGALPTALLDLSTRGFTWVDICGANTQIYAAGYAGTSSIIYRTAVLPDGTALAVPTVAAELPDGEIVRSISSYLGFVLVGTDKGVRFCQVNSDGSLTLGGIVTTSQPVYAFEAQDRFVWYGLSNYDGNNSFLGRMDLTTFTSSLVPAYAADLQAYSQGAVRSIITFNNKRYFTVDGYGLVGETSTPVPSGTFVSGVISYGLSDPKVAMFVDIKHEPLKGAIKVGIVADTSDQYVAISNSTTLGTSSVQGSVSPEYSFPAGQLVGENFQIALTLTPDGSGNSPILTRWILRSMPIPIRTAQWNVPLLLFSNIIAGDKDQSMNVPYELNYLYGLWQSQKVFTFQIGFDSYQVVLYDYQWLPDKVNVHGEVEGTFFAQLKEIAG